MKWFIATIVAGMESKGFTTGSKVYFRLMPLGVVHVISMFGGTAIIKTHAAIHHLKCDRTPTGKPIEAVGQGRLSIKWDQIRGGRAFRDLRPNIAA